MPTITGRISVKSFTTRELATILAALRHWQKQPIIPEDLLDTATGNMQFFALDNSEIDALCERLNS